MRANKTRPKHLVHRDKVQKAVELRMQGLNFQKIADKLRLSSKSYAYELVAGELAERAKLHGQNADLLRQLEIERYDHWLDKLGPKIRRGDPKAINTAIAVSKRRAALLGLDAPARTEVSGPNGGPLALECTDAELMASIAATAAEAAGKAEK